MSEIEAAISKLHKTRASDKNYICPCHDDKKGSLSVDEGADGKLLIKCFAGCKFEDIIKMLDLRPVRAEPSTSPVITATYDYTDKEGTLLYQVVRYHPKTFKQRRPDGSGGWVWDLKGIIPMLYHLPELLEAKMVWVVEGEKDVDNLRKQGQIAFENTLPNDVAYDSLSDPIEKVYETTLSVKVCPTCKRAITKTGD